MKKLLFIALFSFSIHAFSEWEFVTINEDASALFWVDIDNIRERDGYTFFWQLINYEKPSKMPSGEYYQSGIIYKQADCKLFKVKDLQTSVYPKIHGMGKKIMEFQNDSDWKYPVPNTVMHIILNRICE